MPRVLHPQTEFALFFSHYFMRWYWLIPVSRYYIAKSTLAEEDDRKENACCCRQSIVLS